MCQNMVSLHILWLAMVMVGVKEHRKCMKKVPLSLEIAELLRSLKIEQNVDKAQYYGSPVIKRNKKNNLKTTC